MSLPRYTVMAVDRAGSSWVDIRLDDPKATLTYLEGERARNPHRFYWVEDTNDAERAGIEDELEDLAAAAEVKPTLPAPLRVVAALFAMLLSTCAAHAADTFWLDLASYPAIPGWSVRHLQTVHTLEAGGDEPDMLGRAQHATEISAKEARGLLTGLKAWARGIEPPNQTVWKKQQVQGAASYTLEVTSRPGPGRHLVVSSVGVATLPGQGCPQCYGVVYFGRQQMPVSESEAADLIAGLETWVGGQDPPDAIVWSKIRVVQ